MRPRLTWDALGHRTQLKLFKQGDSRVPAGFMPNPPGRPKGSPVSDETRRKISASRLTPQAKERLVARAINDLTRVFGSLKAAVKHLKEQ